MKLMIDIDDVGWNDVVMGYMPASKALIMGVRSEEVITCKDCKYWLKQGHGYPNVCIRDDMELALDESVPLEMDADDFCSKGERK